MSLQDKSSVRKMEADNQDNQNENTTNQEEEDGINMLKRPPAALNLTCGVCTAPAPDHLHFGAHTCYSCRAFFRRTAQRKLAKGLKRCKTGLKKCEVSDQTKTCIHCRYLKCLNIGMAPDLLQGKRQQYAGENQKGNGNGLNDDDKNARKEAPDPIEDSQFRNIPSLPQKLLESVVKPENDKTRKFLNPDTLRYPANTQESQPMSQRLEQLSSHCFGYHPQGMTHRKQDTDAFRQPFTPSSLSLTSSLSHSSPTYPSTISSHNSSYPPTSPTYSGYSCPTSTITSHRYKREQEQDSKNKIAMFGGNIKKEPTFLDNLDYKESMPSTSLYVNPQMKFKQNIDSPQTSFHKSFQQGEATPVKQQARYPDSVTHIDQVPGTSRPSVIRSLNAATVREQTFLQFEAQMLNYHGDLLKQTGSLFNYHASILNQHRIKQSDIIQEPRVNRGVEPSIEVIDIVKLEVEDDLDIINEDILSFQNEIKPSVNKGVDELMIETEDLLENSPWAMAMDKYLYKDSGLNLDDLVDNIMHPHIGMNDKEERNKVQSYDIDTITDLHFTKDDNLPDDVDASFSPRYTSVIRGPEMVFSMEEINLLNRNKKMHEGINRRTCPVSVHQAWVGLYLGKISKEAMLSVVAAGRKSQNYYHYMSMVSQPFFNQLTTRTQNLLMRHNTHLCWSLTMANYFFGHNAKTLVDQEEMTGIVTGLGDFIRACAPGAVNMPITAYDDYFAGPWATAREHEAKHRELTKCIGESVRDLDYSAYLLLYGITLYSISQQTMDGMDIPQKDRQVIGKAQNYMELLYKRYTKHLIGWKKASDTRLNQRYLLDKMGECVLIFSMKNLHLNDLTDSKTLDVSSVK